MKTQLTIVDYLNKGQANLKPTAKLSSLENSPQQVKTFEDILTAASVKQEKYSQITVSSAANKGRTLVDYLKNPILSRSISVIKSDIQNIDDNAGNSAKINPERTGNSNRTNPESSPFDIKIKEQPKSDKQDIRQKIDASIARASQKYDVSEELIRGIVRAESGFQPHVVSPAGARGLMQLMPETAKELGVNDPYDIEENIDGGVRYFKQMMDMFDGDIKLSLAAYNAGPGTVRRYEGIPPYKETQQYVRKVIKFSNQIA